MGPAHGDGGVYDFWFFFCVVCGAVLDQAAVKASLDGAKAITTEALEWAKDKILMGAERRSAVISEETAKCTAFHEGGHAIVVRERGEQPAGFYPTTMLDYWRLFCHGALVRESRHACASARNYPARPGRSPFFWFFVYFYFFPTAFVFPLRILM